MSTVLLKGKKVSRFIYEQIDSEIFKLDKVPKLVIVVIGSDSASEFYVNILVKNGKIHNINVEVRKFSQDVSEKEILELIEELNTDNDVSGIMLQKPFPKQINDDKITSLISPSKDVDGFHPENIGKLVLGKPSFIPCTSAAVLEVLKFYYIETYGKNIKFLTNPSSRPADKRRR